ncbi:MULTISPECIES: hypothetical protein [unclassified Microcoleus]|uniref:hypothetical protein n=1 Tax=unclassified Microcoleus TaxID=2642155 RepID=UPI002FD6A916
MKKKVVFLVCLLISAGLGGAVGPESIAIPVRSSSNTLSADIAATAADLSGLVLTLQDLPAGFTKVPLDPLKNKDSFLPDFKPASVFGYLKNDDQPFQIVVGFTTQLSNQSDRAKFDAAISEGSFAQVFYQYCKNSNKEAQFTNLTALTLEDKIGELSGGWRTQERMPGETANFEFAVFRRGQIGSFMIIMYFDGSKPPVTISSVARQLDRRIMELKPDLTQPQ